MKSFKLLMFVGFIFIFMSYIYASPQICEAKAGASCYYISVNGNNNNNSGSFNSPYKTALPALQRAKPGDFIYFRGGTYGKANSMVTGTDKIVGNHYEMIGIDDFDGWDSNAPAYTVRDGTAKNPITIKAYPGEHVVFDVLNFTKSNVAIRVEGKSYWNIEGFEIIGGMIYVNNYISGNNTHNIIIKNNNIHNMYANGGTNPGLIKIDRSDYGGAYNIFIYNNTLHNIYDVSYPNIWKNSPDLQHFGAVTVLSDEVYHGIARGGTKYIEIANNTMYDLPQVFFFKNPMKGPIYVHNNIIFNSSRLMKLASSNLKFSNNLVFNVTQGIFVEQSTDNSVVPLWAQNTTVVNNTFVGIGNVLMIRQNVNNKLEDNVFYNLTGKYSQANWNTYSYISKGESVFANDISNSILHKTYSNNNCFITPNNDILFVKRYTTPIDVYNVKSAQNVFGYDQNSIFLNTMNLGSIFNSNFNVKKDSPCYGKGYNSNDFLKSSTNNFITNNNNNNSTNVNTSKNNSISPINQTNLSTANISKNNETKNLNLSKDVNNSNNKNNNKNDCTPKFVFGNWSKCNDGFTERTIKDNNGCYDNFIERKSCLIEKNVNKNQIRNYTNADNSTSSLISIEKNNNSYQVKSNLTPGLYSSANKVDKNIFILTDANKTQYIAQFKNSSNGKYLYDLKKVEPAKALALSNESSTNTNTNQNFFSNFISSITNFFRGLFNYFIYK